MRFATSCEKKVMEKNHWIELNRDRIWTDRDLMLCQEKSSILPHVYGASSSDLS